MSMSSSKRIHIIKRGARWAVRREDAQKATRVFKTVEEAVKTAKEQTDGDIVIHKQDGSIQKWERADAKQAG